MWPILEIIVQWGKGLRYRITETPAVCRILKTETSFFSLPVYSSVGAATACFCHVLQSLGTGSGSVNITWCSLLCLLCSAARLQLSIVPSPTG